MNIHQTQPLPVKRAPLNQRHNLLMRCHVGLRQRLKQGEKLGAICETATGDLADHIGMHCDLPRSQQVLQMRVGAAQMINPDGCVNEDHGSEPPSANRPKAPLRAAKVR